jgi:hypothetical protein
MIYEYEQKVQQLKVLWALKKLSQFYLRSFRVIAYAVHLFFHPHRTPSIENKAY